MGQGNGLRRSRYTYGDFIIGAGETGAVLYVGNGLQVGSVGPHSCAPPSLTSSYLIESF